MVDYDGPRRISVHLTLGGGPVADILLWRRPGGSVGLLISVTALWFLFEKAGYNPLTFVANVLLLLVVILFFWAKSASLLNRPLPPIPDMEISDKSVGKAAVEIRRIFNHTLSIAREITVGGNLRVLFKVAIVLLAISYVGSLCNFITFVYLGFLISLLAPPLYEKYQYPIDDKLGRAYKILDAQFIKVDAGVLRRFPNKLYKSKKKSQ